MYRLTIRESNGRINSPQDRGHNGDDDAQGVEETIHPIDTGGRRCVTLIWYVFNFLSSYSLRHSRMTCRPRATWTRLGNPPPPGTVTKVCSRRNIEFTVISRLHVYPLGWAFEQNGAINQLTQLISNKVFLGIYIHNPSVAKSDEWRTKTYSIFWNFVRVKKREKIE